MTDITSNIWFTSDHHFGHKNIIRFSNRPFTDVFDMDEALIGKWNAVVGIKDTVYHLGDIFFCPSSEARLLRERLNGSIHLIRGNHDKGADSIRDAFEWIKDIHELTIDDADAEGGKQRITLCHYAMRVWNHSHHGAWHLYGHSHGSLEDDTHSLSFDVGVDCHNFQPISYKTVKDIMSAKTFTPIDHHGRN